MHRALPVLVASLCSFGCPGTPEPVPDAGVDAGPGLSPVELCDRLAKARCELMTACYPAFLRESAQSCQASQQSSCLLQYDGLRLSFEEGKIEIDVAAVERCEARMAARTCPPSFPPGYKAATSPFSECELGPSLLRGRVANGESCRNAVECSPGITCLKPNGVCNGTCSTSPLEGEPCAFGCAGGLFCDTKATQDTSDDRCKKVEALGGSCLDSTQCEESLVCSNGSCRAKGRVNEACRWDPNRTSTCEAGLACDVAPFVDGATGQCIKPRTVVQKCRFHWSCEPGLVCAGIDWTGFPTTAPTEGECIPPQPTSSACSFTIYSTYVGDTCQTGTACSETSTCRALGARGESCTPSAVSCAGSDVFCRPSTGGNVGICSGPAALNERCGVAIDNDRTVRVPCSAGYCEESTLTCRTGNRQIGQACQSDAECSSNRCAVQQDRSQRCAIACN